MKTLEEASQHEWYRTIPQITLQSIHDYVYHGWHPGDFLASVLENDLTQAALRADINNQRALWAIALYCFHEVPAICRRDNFYRWIRHRGLDGFEQAKALYQTEG
jgi:hypothetical protein